MASRRIFTRKPLIVTVVILLSLGGYSVVANQRTPTSVLQAVVERVVERRVEPVEILFLGDLMIDRGVASHAETHGDASLLAGVENLFAGMDSIVANLEGTITNYPSVARPHHTDLRFTFDPRFAPYLKQAGITVVSLSNNHTDDFGADGYAQTKRHLDAAGIVSFGSPANDRDISTHIVVGDTRVCFVGYQGFVNTDPAPIADEIRRIRSECDVMAATMHAGEEYERSYTPLQQRAAYAFIDAGADVVIGTHPHIVTPLEMYKGKAIFYSLGNFLFDQHFSWATTHGLAVRMTLMGEEIRYTLIPTMSVNSEAAVTTNEVDIARTLEALITPELSPDIASDILNRHVFSAVWAVQDSNL